MSPTTLDSRMAGEVARTPHLRNLLVQLYQESTVNEYVSVVEERRARDAYFMNLVSDETRDEGDRIQLLIQLCQRTEGEAYIFSANLVNLYNAILACEDEVLHPYREMPRFGGRRLQTWDAVAARFGGQTNRYLRFSVDQLRYIGSLLQVPEQIRFETYLVTGVEALSIHLYRLATGARCLDMVEIFDLRASVISIVFNGMTVFLFGQFKDLVMSFTNSFTTDFNRLAAMADTVEGAGCVLPNVVGWVDGTAIQVCRPVRDQRSIYCGNHRIHCIKSLGLQLANGVLLAFGPFLGTQPDSVQAREMGLPGLLAQHWVFPGRTFILYADGGFAIGPQLITPYRRGAGRDPAEQRWNQ